MESLFSLEVIVNYIKLNHEKISCLFPSVAFRLLDYPTIGIHLLDDVDAKQLRSKLEIDRQFDIKFSHFPDLLDKHGRYIFAKGKSCLFRSDLEVLRGHLRNAPLYLMVLDTYYEPFKLLGTATVPLNNIMEQIYAELVETDLDMPCTKITHGVFDFKNLMGDDVGHVSFACRLSSFGSTLLPHIGVTSEAIERQKMLKKVEKQSQKQKFDPKSVAIQQKLEQKVIETQTEVKSLSASFVQTMPIDYRNAQIQISNSENRTDQATQIDRHEQMMKNASNQVTLTKNVKVKTTKVIEDEFVFNHYCPPPLFYNSDKVESKSQQVITTITTVQSTATVSKSEYEKKRIEFLKDAIVTNFENYDPAAADETVEADGGENLDDENEEYEEQQLVQARQTRNQAANQANTNFNLQDFPVLNCLIEEIMRMKSATNTNAGSRPVSAPVPKRKPVGQTKVTSKQQPAVAFKQPVSILKGKIKHTGLDKEHLFESVNRLSRPRIGVTPRKTSAQSSPEAVVQQQKAAPQIEQQKKKTKLKYGTTLTQRMRVLASRPQKVEKINEEHEDLVNELRAKLDELSDSSRNVTPLASVAKSKDGKQPVILSNSTGTSKSPLNLSLLNKVEMESTIDYAISRNLFNSNSQDAKNTNDDQPRASSSLGQNTKFVQFGNTYVLNHPSDDSTTPVTASATSTTTTTHTTTSSQPKEARQVIRKSPNLQSQSIDSLKTHTNTSSSKYTSNDFEEDVDEENEGIGSLKMSQINLNSDDLDPLHLSSSKRSSSDYSRTLKTIEDEDDLYFSRDSKSSTK